MPEMDRYPQRNELPQVVPEELIAGSASAEFTKELKRERREKWWRRTWITIAVSAGFAVMLSIGYIIWRASNPTVVREQAPAATQPTQQVATLYYAIQTDQVVKPERTWPTFTIYQRTAGGGNEKELFKVGTEANYPADLAMDKAGKYLAVNYQTKLTVYELPSGKEAFSLSPGTGLVYSQPVFSPDGTQLFAFEITAANNDKPGSLFADVITLESGQPKREVITATIPSLNAIAWAPSNRIVASFISNSEFTMPYVFDLQSLAATKVSETVDSVTTSDDGAYILAPTQGVPDAANCISGQTPSGFTVFDSKTLKQTATYSDGSTVITPGSPRFSSDNTKVLLQRYAPLPGLDCASAGTPDYELTAVTLSDGKTEVITEDNLAKAGFTPAMQIVPDDPITPKLNFLKYGKDIIHSTAPDKLMKIIGQVTPTN